MVIILSIMFSDKGSEPKVVTLILQKFIDSANIT